MRSKGLLPFLVIFFGSSSCHRFEQNSKLRIVGGRPANWDQSFRRHVVGLADHANSAPHCTGTLITENAVLTAAHCIRDSGSVSERQFIYFGRGSQGEGETWLPVTDQTAFGDGQFDLSGFFPNYDLAVLRFEGALPKDFTPAELESDSESLKNVADRLVIAGYGAQGFSGDLETPINNGEVNFAEVKLLKYEDSPLQRAQIRFDQMAMGEPRSSCFGDSGGPLFVKTGADRYRLAGVANGTDPRLDHVRPARCKEGISIYTFIGNYAEWLASQGISIKASVNVRQEREKRPPTTLKHSTLASWCADFGVSYEEEAALQWLAWKVDEVSCLTLAEKAMSVELLTPELMFTPPAVSLLPLATLPALRSISVRATRIDPPGSLAALTQTKEISISDQIWTELPELKSLAGLETLRVRGARLQIEKMKGLPPNLSTLDLSNNNLTAFPDLVGLGRLRELNLSGNDIHALPTAAANWQIEVLDLSRNSIVSLDGIDDFDELRVLDLAHNLVSDWSQLTQSLHLTDLVMYGNPVNADKCPIVVPNTCQFSLPDGPHDFYTRGKATAKQDTYLTRLVADPAKLPAFAKCAIPAGTMLSIKGYTQFDRQIRDQLHARVDFAETADICPDFEGGYLRLSDFDFPLRR
jgi:hypothetical protein